jgi:Icc-related predicted phosphoesterase
MIRIAAVGDLHLTVHARGRMAPQLEGLDAEADVLLLAGDLTNWGKAEEAEILVEEFAGVEIPCVAVLGNHDYHSEGPDRVRTILEAGGITVLDNESTLLTVGSETLGIVGGKGFGGGFGTTCLSPFGEREIRDFLKSTYACAEALDRELAGMQTDYRLVLLHYSPAVETLKGEPVAIYPFLGSSIMGEPIDAHGADLVVHGHAHKGTEHGKTAGGIPVRNVSLPVICESYALYQLQPKAEALAH